MFSSVIALMNVCVKRWAVSEEVLSRDLTTEETHRRCKHIVETYRALLGSVNVKCSEVFRSALQRKQKSVCGFRDLMGPAGLMPQLGCPVPV